MSMKCVLHIVISSNFTAFRSFQIFSWNVLEFTTLKKHCWKSKLLWRWFFSFFFKFEFSKQNWLWYITYLRHKSISQHLFTKKSLQKYTISVCKGYVGCRSRKEIDGFTHRTKFSESYLLLRHSNHCVHLQNRKDYFVEFWRITQFLTFLRKMWLNLKRWKNIAEN